MSQKTYMRYEKIILGQIRCEEAPQVVPACQGGKHPNHHYQRQAPNPYTIKSSQDHVLRVHPGQQTVFSA